MKEAFRRQALEYRHEKDRAEAWLCSMIVSSLAWVLGEVKAPTVRVKLDDTV